jgi:hypothetical protein
MFRLRCMARLDARPRRALLAALCIAAAGISACSGAQNGQAPAESATSPDAAGEAPAEGAAEPSPPVAAPHGKRAPCSTDQSCNEDPAVSSLWGRCTEMGICECNPGFERSPTSDLCRPAR